MTVRRLRQYREPCMPMRIKSAFVLMCAVALAACSTGGAQQSTSQTSEVVVRPSAPQTSIVAATDQANVPQYQPSVPVLTTPVDPDQVSVACAEVLAPARDIYSKWLAGLETPKADLDRAAAIVDGSTKTCTQTDLYLFQKEMFPQMLTPTTVK